MLTHSHTDQTCQKHCPNLPLKCHILWTNAAMSPWKFKNVPCLQHVLSGGGHQNHSKNMKKDRYFTRFLTYCITTLAVLQPPVWLQKKISTSQSAIRIPSPCTPGAVLPWFDHPQYEASIGASLGSCLVQPPTCAPYCREACGTRTRRAAYIEFVRVVESWRKVVESWRIYANFSSYFQEYKMYIDTKTEHE